MEWGWGDTGSMVNQIGAVSMSYSHWMSLLLMLENVGFRPCGRRDVYHMCKHAHAHTLSLSLTHMHTQTHCDSHTH